MTPTLEGVIDLVEGEGWGWSIQRRGPGDYYAEVSQTPDNQLSGQRSGGNGPTPAFALLEACHYARNAAKP